MCVMTVRSVPAAGQNFRQARLPDAKPDFSGVGWFFWKISAEFAEKSALHRLIFLDAT
jgi:hypothetical protein